MIGGPPTILLSGMYSGHLLFLENILGNEPFKQATCIGNFAAFGKWNAGKRGAAIIASDCSHRRYLAVNWQWCVLRWWQVAVQPSVPFRPEHADMGFRTTDRSRMYDSHPRCPNPSYEK